MESWGYPCDSPRRTECFHAIGRINLNKTRLASTHPVVRDELPGLDYELMRAIATLSEEHQTVVRELVAALRRAEKPAQGE